MFFTGKEKMEKILIIDFGSQVTQLIARRVRESGVYCEIQPFNKVNIDTIKDFNPKGIILSGGPQSVYEENSPKITRQIFDLGLPIFGICYGQQLMCQELGGSVESCLLYTSPSPRDATLSRMPSSA